MRFDKVIDSEIKSRDASLLVLIKDLHLCFFQKKGIKYGISYPPRLNKISKTCCAVKKNVYICNIYIGFC